MTVTSSIRTFPTAITKLASDPFVAKALGEKADDIAGLARGLAPIRTGRYRSSIRSTRSSGIGEGTAATVVAQTPYAAFIEYGTGPPGPTPKFRTLRKAAALQAKAAGNRRRYRAVRGK